MSQDLIDAYQDYLSLSLRKILLRNDISFNDLCFESSNSSQNLNMVASLNTALQKIHFPFSISSISLDKVGDINTIIVVLRTNIETLFDEYEEGYLLPTYTMLHMECSLNDDMFYKFLHANNKLQLSFSKENGIRLLERTSSEKTQRYIRYIKNTTLIEIIKD